LDRGLKAMSFTVQRFKNSLEVRHVAGRTTAQVRLGIELQADALLSNSGAQAYSIALKRAKASSDQMARDWSVVAAIVARKSGVRSSLLDALFA
jgi:hypothetical protein